MENNVPANTAEVEVLSFRQFAWKRGYDIEISHDRLRFPHGISKIQAKRNRAAAKHTLGHVFSAAQAYQEALEAGTVRPPNDGEEMAGRFLAHPDHESTKATWRVLVKRKLRRESSLTEQVVVTNLISERMGGIDCWMETLGLTATAELSEMARIRVLWMKSDGVFVSPPISSGVETEESSTVSVENREEQLALL